MKIGEIIPLEREIELNAGRKTIELEVSNSGDRPIQVGSHYSFFEVNKLLRFDRSAAFGFRLNIPSGAAVRFEAGETKTVELVELGGGKKTYGLNGLTNGGSAEQAIACAKRKGFL